MFFIVVVVITCIPQISPVSPYTSYAARRRAIELLLMLFLNSISGLVFILAVSAIREAYEDWVRHSFLF